MDIQAAIGYVVAHGDQVDRARLSWLRSGVAPRPDVLALAEMGQAPGGGWPASRDGQVPSIDATCFRLAELDDLGALGRPAAQQALAWLAGRQRPDGTWEEDEALADSAPSWARPGDPEARLYLTVNAAYWLAVAGPPVPSPAPAGPLGAASPAPAGPPGLPPVSAGPSSVPGSPSPVPNGPLTSAGAPAAGPTSAAPPAAPPPTRSATVPAAAPGLPPVPAAPPGPVPVPAAPPGPVPVPAAPPGPVPGAAPPMPAPVPAATWSAVAPSSPPGPVAPLRAPGPVAPLPTPEAAARAEVVARATQAFRAALREDGSWPSYLVTGWLGAALLFHAGWFYESARIQVLLAGRVPEMSAGDVAWLAATFRRVGMSLDDWLLAAARKRLAETQSADGSWPSDDGAAFDVHATLAAIRALR